MTKKITRSRAIFLMLMLVVVLGTIFMMGVAFELPILTWLISRIGLVTREQLKYYRRHAVVILLIAAALITPSGDPFTLMVVFLPLYLLYEAGICFASPAEQEQ